MDNQKRNKTKKIIIALAALLGLSLAALAGTLIYNRFNNNRQTTVTVPDNLISPGSDSSNSETSVPGNNTLKSWNEKTSSGETSGTDKTEAAASTQSTAAETKNAIAIELYNQHLEENTPFQADNMFPGDSETSAPGNSTAKSGNVPPTEETSGTDKTEAAASAQSMAAETKNAFSIELYNKQPEENTPFQVGNMFPGDRETKYYRVQVSYHDAVTVHYRATVRPGYEKLVQVLKVRIRLLTTGETMYDGLMRDMPKSVAYKLQSKSQTTDELYYEITAYLETSVGNEYQDKDLIADFSWWVEESENLIDPPKTGDNFPVYLWICLASAALFLLIVLWRKRRKEDVENECKQ